MRLGLDPDRLLPIEPSARAVARRLYDSVSDAPILSPHGHVDPRLLLDDLPFSDPVELLVRHDHYVTRMLHASGVSLERLGLDPTVASTRARCGGSSASTGTRFAGHGIRLLAERRSWSSNSESTRSRSSTTPTRSTT